MTVYFEVEKIKAATDEELRNIIDDMIHAMMYPFQYHDVNTLEPFARAIAVKDSTGERLAFNMVALRYAWFVLRSRLESS